GRFVLFTLGRWRLFEEHRELSVERRLHVAHQGTEAALLGNDLAHAALADAGVVFVVEFDDVPIDAALLGNFFDRRYAAADLRLLLGQRLQLEGLRLQFIRRAPPGRFVHQRRRRAAVAAILL